MRNYPLPQSPDECEVIKEKFKNYEQAPREIPIKNLQNSVEEKQQMVEDKGMNTMSKEVIDAKLETIEVKMDGKIASIQSSIDQKFSELKADIEKSSAELRADMHKGTSELTKWIIGVALTSMAVFITVITFVLNNAVPKTPAPVSTPAPIVIQIPQQSVPQTPVTK